MATAALQRASANIAMPRTAAPMNAVMRMGSPFDVGGRQTRKNPPEVIGRVGCDFSKIALRAFRTDLRPQSTVGHTHRRLSLPGTKPSVSTTR
jgi:hypothetical protein